MIFPKTDVGARKMNPFAEKTERFFCFREKVFGRLLHIYILSVIIMALIVVENGSFAHESGGFESEVVGNPTECSQNSAHAEQKTLRKPQKSETRAKGGIRNARYAIEIRSRK